MIKKTSESPIGATKATTDLGTVVPAKRVRPTSRRSFPGVAERVPKNDEEHLAGMEAAEEDE